MYKNSLDTFWKVLRFEGFFGLYRGEFRAHNHVRGESQAHNHVRGESQSCCEHRSSSRFNVAKVISV